jgi:hypothetical protein
MIISRQNLKGGKRLKGFTITEENGTIGYKLGYCSHCNEPLIMCLRDRDELIATFHCADETYKKVKRLLDPDPPFQFKGWLIRVLGGEPVERPIDF